MPKLHLLFKRYSLIAATILITCALILVAASLSAYPQAGHSLTQLSLWLTQHKLYFIFWHIILTLAIGIVWSFKVKQFSKKGALTSQQAIRLKWSYWIAIAVIWMLILMTFR